MKKFLVLALVLGIAGLANAGLTVSYDGSAVSVSSEEALLGGINACIGINVPGALDSTLVTDAGITYRTGTPPTAPIATPAVYLYSGADIQNPEIWGLPYNAGLINVVWGDSETDPTKANPAGFWFSMPLTGYIAGTANDYDLQVDVLDGFGAVNGTVYLSIVPEPVTMLLLGLGGLFIRRK